VNLIATSAVCEISSDIHTFCSDDVATVRADRLHEEILQPRQKKSFDNMNRKMVDLDDLSPLEMPELICN